MKTMITLMLSLLTQVIIADQLYPPRPGYNNGEIQSPSGCFAKVGFTYSITNSLEWCHVPQQSFARQTWASNIVSAHIWPSGDPNGYFYDYHYPLTNVVSCGAILSFAAAGMGYQYWPNGDVAWTDAGAWWTTSNAPTAYNLASPVHHWKYQLDGYAYMFCQQIDNNSIEVLDIHEDPVLPIYPPAKSPVIGAPPFKTAPIFTAPTLTSAFIKASPLAVGGVVNDTDTAQVWSSTNLAPSAWALSASVALSTNTLLVDPNVDIPSVSLTNATITLPGTNGPFFWRTVVNSNMISPLQCLYTIPVPSFLVVSAAGQLLQFQDNYALSNQFSSTPSDYFITAGTNNSTWPEWDNAGSNYWTSDSYGVLPPGQGMWFGSDSYSNEMLVFQGGVAIGTNDLAIHAGRNALAWPRPEAINLGSAGLPSSPSDVVSVWNVSLQNFVTYTNRAGTWTPALPTLQIGDSFILDTTNASMWHIWFYDPIMYQVIFAPASTVTNLTVTCANGLTHAWTNGPTVVCLSDQLRIQDSRMGLTYTNLDVGAFTGTDFVDDAALFSGDLLLTTPYASRGVVTKAILTTPPDTTSITNYFISY